MSMMPIVAYLHPTTPVMVMPPMMVVVVPSTVRLDDNARCLCRRTRNGDAAKSDHSSNQ